MDTDIYYTPCYDVCVNVEFMEKVTNEEKTNKKTPIDECKIVESGRGFEEVLQANKQYSMVALTLALEKKAIEL